MADELFDRSNGRAAGRYQQARFCLGGTKQSHFVYVVRTGDAALLWPDAEDAARMEIAGPGSVVGLPAAINGTYSVAAKTEARDYEDFTAREVQGCGGFVPVFSASGERRRSGPATARTY